MTPSGLVLATQEPSNVTGHITSSQVLRTASDAERVTELTAGELFQAMREHVREARRADEDDALLAHVLALARAQEIEERAWAMTALGGVLAAFGHLEDALETLRAAVRLQPSAQTKLAALVCAAAIRCDQGEYADAVRIGELVLTRTGDASLLRVLGEVYLRTAAEAADGRLREQGRRCFERAELEDALTRA